MLPRRENICIICCGYVYVEGKTIAGSDYYSLLCLISGGTESPVWSLIINNIIWMIVIIKDCCRSMSSEVST